mmetsp:Transcript_34314/g.98486  ORF Transcript_34314/g.98486 Transcript_34314/m.98486 type:complete len:313 (+) Transcript_34314:1057-1995(+)
MRGDRGLGAPLAGAGQHPARCQHYGGRRRDHDSLPDPEHASESGSHGAGLEGRGRRHGAPAADLRGLGPRRERPHHRPRAQERLRAGRGEHPGDGELRRAQLRWQRHHRVHGVLGSGLGQKEDLERGGRLGGIQGLRWRRQWNSDEEGALQNLDRPHQRQDPSGARRAGDRGLLGQLRHLRRRCHRLRRVHVHADRGRGEPGPPEREAEEARHNGRGRRARRWRCRQGHGPLLLLLQRRAGQADASAGQEYILRGKDDVLRDLRHGQQKVQAEVRREAQVGGRLIWTDELETLCQHRIWEAIGSAWRSAGEP